MSSLYAHFNQLSLILPIAFPTSRSTSVLVRSESIDTASCMPESHSSLPVRSCNGPGYPSSPRHPLYRNTSISIYIKSSLWQFSDVYLRRNVDVFCSPKLSTVAEVVYCIEYVLQGQVSFVSSAWLIA
ncbi:hypothetical protein NEOLEDRAFT_338524 [Neolentinus lepideus HHB14362 ss-1]|uniref:Uncharacterized protein n=1 Tax=Neolentinus lepideus HHB14362 ss-1 TaxID=1314782 RepID=A0A165SVU3_9AGAM|nr:hypothetical protein NEOLEDRAFT_338524 [Neolentinus lepideus HHB14362 ss-1]